MKGKKILGVLLTVALMVSIMIPVASAAGTPTVSISSGQAKPGESVTLTVSIENNPGIATCMLYFYYDTDVFEVEPSSDIRSIDEFRYSGGLIGNSIAIAKANGRYEGAVGKDGVLVLWYNRSGLNITDNGAMLEITLKVVSTAVAGSYSVTLGYSAQDTGNEKGEKVALKTIGGTITVVGGSSSQGGEQTITPDAPAVNVPQFPDAQGHWAQPYIESAAERGLILGNDYGMYMPDKTMTRAECVTILWRACGSPKPTKSAGFTDLDPAQTWYHDAVAWAAETGVVKGTGENKFSPLGTVNRDQLATILHRMAGGTSGAEIMYTSIYDAKFTDSGKIASWAKSGLYWSVYNNIYCGENSVEFDTQLAPTAAATRAQIAVMMVRYLENQGGN